jgi:hypothetical protein
MRKSRNYEKVIKLFKPDTDGKSKWVSVKDFATVELNWSKNGNARHGVFFNVSQLKWEKKEAVSSTTVTHLRTVGWNTKPTFNQRITPKVKKHFEGENLCSISLLPIPKTVREIDHRYGNKTHPDYVAMYSAVDQDPKNFQLIFSVLNSAKRQICKVCCETKIRPAHPTLGFVEGDQTHAESFPCKGCYLAEPERYRALED